jgi:hypothetical protein
MELGGITLNIEIDRATMVNLIITGVVITVFAVLFSMVVKKMAK